MFDAGLALNFAHELGEELGRSVEAMENKPTFAQSRTARRRMIERYPGIDELGDRDFWPVFEGAFENGYAIGKSDPVGARRRVQRRRTQARNRRASC